MSKKVRATYYGPIMQGMTLGASYVVTEVPGKFNGGQNILEVTTDHGRKELLPDTYFEVTDNLENEGKMPNASIYVPDSSQSLPTESVSEEPYHLAARRTMNHDFKGIRARLNTVYDIALLNAALGLTGEAGEFAELVKKMLMHGQPIEKVKFLNELGDLRWYLELACSSLGFSMEQVERANIAKLRKRYPNGFNIADASKRADEK